MTSEHEIILRIGKKVSDYAKAVIAAEYWIEKASEFNIDEHEIKIIQIDAEYEEEIFDANLCYEQESEQIQHEINQLPWPKTVMYSDWNEPNWKTFSPYMKPEIPKYTRVGMLNAHGEFSHLEIPALIPIIGARNLIIKAQGNGKERARIAIQTIMLRLLTTMHPGKLRFVCIDPVGLGTTMAGFIKDLPDFLTGGYAWFDTNHIDAQLAKLESHMANVKQKYLGVRYKTMEEYNKDAGEVAEPYRLLVVSDFPSRFSENASRRLISIATNGPATGVYLIMMVDVEQKMPYDFNLSDIERNSTIIICQDNSDVWNDSDFEKCILTFDDQPSSDLFEYITKSIGEASIKASEVKVPFVRYSIPENQWWQQDSRSEIKIPIGRIGAEELLYFELNEQLISSALIIGRPGSGKSTLLHTLIINLAINYSPDNLEFYLLDLKQVEFEDYASKELPHARVVAIQSEREFGLSVLRGLDEELQRRSDLFRDSGYVALSEYRNLSNKRKPRILLIIDEFQELFSEDDLIAQEASQILDRLIRMGRAFGINTLLSSQTLAGPYNLPRATKDQIPLRITLQCSDADSRLALSDENDAARRLERPGEAIYNSKNGSIEGNNHFQVFWLTPDERERYLHKIKGTSKQLGFIQSQPQTIFRGNELGNIELNSDLTDLLLSNQWTEIQRAHKVWLGAPVEIKSHTSAIFRRQSRSNLLIIGQRKHESTATSLLITSLISLAAQYHPNNVKFVILNLTDVDSKWYELPNILKKTFPHEITIIQHRNAVSYIEELARELYLRLASTDDMKWETYYFFIMGLHRARDFRRNENTFYTSENDVKKPNTLLMEISRDGPDVGIHTLLWCDTYSNLERVYDRQPEMEFDLRVALPMNAEDSRHLLDIDTASKIGPYNALFCDDEHIGSPEKFRPYSLPSIDWIKNVGKILSSRV